jgi:Fe-S-cluster-containing dehydrogenase component
MGQSTVKAVAFSNTKAVDLAAKELLGAKGKSLVVSNSNDANVQLLVNAINNMLGNYGKTIDLSSPSYLKQGSDADLKALMADMKSGKVGALFVGANTNPAYTLANADAFVKSLSKVDLTVSFSLYNDETAAHMQFVCPDQHFLESWGDAMPKAGHYSLQQPTIRPLFDTRQMQDSFLKWSGASQDYYAYLTSYWKSNILGTSSWNKTLHDGVFVKNTTVDVANFAADVNAAANAVSKVKAGKFEIELYEKVSMGTGSMANNPWLQEMPDPVTKNTWDNYLTVSKSTAVALELTNWNVSNGALNGDMVNITVNGVVMNNVPVMIQPGQAKDTFGLALGYGRNVGKEQNIVGVNAFPLMNGTSNATFDVKIEKAEGEHHFAATQLHHTMMGRAIVKEATLADYIKNPKAGNPDILLDTHEGKKPVDKLTLWADHEKGVHFWNLSIDLTSCIGCGNCVVSCQSENNVPVVGKEEVRKSRDMHWIRIDRYFSSDEEDKSKDDRSFDLMEDASENPEVVYMPVMCQHCNHAPCETVCPVAATTHSSEGLNHMAYNRCIGTRYCANNCPYKVRRFNWFNYPENDAFNFNMNDDLGKMVLNPDVVVRTRGVMEKCSMCIQRIQYGKLEAKKGNRKVVDGDIQTACSSVCPTNAIVFGDAQDRSSKVAELKGDERSYHLLEELGTQPSVFYQTKIRNKA